MIAYVLGALARGRSWVELDAPIYPKLWQGVPFYLSWWQFRTLCRSNNIEFLTLNTSVRCWSYILLNEDGRRQQLVSWYGVLIFCIQLQQVYICWNGFSTHCYSFSWNMMPVFPLKKLGYWALSILDSFLAVKLCLCSAFGWYCRGVGAWETQLLGKTSWPAWDFVGKCRSVLLKTLRCSFRLYLPMRSWNVRFCRIFQK